MSVKPTIALIQFRLSRVAARLEVASIARELGDGVVVEALSALTTDFSDVAYFKKRYEGFVLGGSGDFDFDGNRPSDDPVRLESRAFLEKISPLLVTIFDHNVPLFGICYGHQLIGAFHGVPVVYDETQRKTRSHVLVHTEEGSTHQMLSGTPQTFTAHYGHKDVLETIPETALLILSGGEECRVSALAYSDAIVTTQFHPELTVADWHERSATLGGYLPAGVGVDELFIESPHAHTLLRNFAKLVG